MGNRFPLPRAAYVHVPFCRHRCGYCNFTLVAGRDDLVADYLRAVAIELSRVGIAHQDPECTLSVGNAHLTSEDKSEVDTLYFGGGTPTYLRPDHLRELT